MDSVEALAEEIRAALQKAAGDRPPGTGSAFNKPGDEWVSYGLRAPVYYAVMRGFRARFRALPQDERLALAASLLAAHIGELGHAGIYVLGPSAGELEPAHYPALDSLAEDFRGWSHVDDFSLGVLQPLLAAHPRETIALLDAWTRSPNRWKRRASVVAFTRKAGESGRYTDVVLDFCGRLARDPEDLVLKGVGWALKDNMRSAPDRVREFVKDLRRQGVSSVVTLYAIRDLKGAERAEVLRRE